MDTHGKRIGALMVVFTGAFTFLMLTAALYAFAASFTGTSHHDVLVGTKHSDTLKGLGGTDDLSGRAGNDKLYGGPGEDFLRGYAGNDVLYGGPDDSTSPKTTDHYRCGSGYDIVHVVGPEHAPHNIAANCEKVVTEH